MPLVILSSLFYGFLAVLLSTGSVYSQSANTSVTVTVNDTTRWSTTGNLALIQSLGGYSGNWLNYTGASTGATSAAISFPGVGLVVYGTVVNGTENRPMNVSVKLDDNDIVIPLYTPNANIAKGFDYNNQIFKNDSLPYRVHTLTITFTGTTSFLLQGILYNSANSPTSSTASLPVGTGVFSPSDSASPSNDTAKLAGAIGGGIGGLLIVGIIIVYMMRRLRRIEKKEKKLQAIPFLANAGNLRSETDTAAARARSVPRTNTQSSTAVDEKKRPKDRSVTTASSSRSFPRNHKSPLPSPAASLISVPSEFQHATTIVPAGTALASSYIGASPLPPVGDAPPVPAIPADVKRKTKSTRRREKQERLDRNASIDQSTPNSGGLGLFSTDSVNTVGTTGSAGLSRPLPIVPGTRSSAPSYQFPAEKIGLSPPPARRERGGGGGGGGGANTKRALPETNTPPSSR